MAHKLQNITCACCTCIHMYVMVSTAFVKPGIHVYETSMLLYLCVL